MDIGNMDLQMIFGIFDGNLDTSKRSFSLAHRVTEPWTFKYIYGASTLSSDITSVVRPFTLLSWMLVLGTAITMTIYLILAKELYMRAAPGHNLVNPNVLGVDIAFKTVCALVEPEGIPYFKKWSTGTKESSNKK